jgi:protein-S-isoprenylcysteine O-methyltransferase Ste14
MDNRFAAWAARVRVPLGFAWGAAFLVFSQPTVRLLEVGGGVALVGVLIRAYSAGYLEKSRKLAIAGPYRFTRNPLYLGSFLIGAGFALASGSRGLGISFLLLFLLIYGTVMRREEDFLRRQFGEDFERYARAVPIFLPVFLRRGDPANPKQRFRWELYRKNHEYEAALGFAAGVVFLALKIWLR